MSIFYDPSRRDLLKLAGAGTLSSAVAGAVPAWAASDYPAKPIRFVVPLPAGGAADVVARVQAPQLEKILKQPVIVDNKPGGSYVVGMNLVSTAPADGYTLMSINISMCSSQAMMRRYDMLKQLAFIGRTGDTHVVLAVSSKSPFKSIAELIAYGKSSQGRLNYAVGGTGSAEHLATVIFERAAGYTSNMIPFKGAIEGITALVAGDIDYQMVPQPLAAQFIPKGLIRPLLAFSSKRLKDYPDVPTAAEIGIPQASFAFWGGVAAPAGTPPDIIHKLHRAFNEVSLNPEVQARLTGVGITMSISETPADFAKEVAAELDRMNAAIKVGNIQLS